MLFLAVLMFLPAGTLDYWQGWLYVGLFAACCALTTASLLKHDPALVARRLEVGPKAEREPAQKRIQWIASLCLCLLYIVSTMDYGQAWSFVPTSVVLLGDLLVVLGFAMMYRVFLRGGHGDRGSGPARHRDRALCASQAPHVCGRLAAVSGNAARLGIVVGPCRFYSQCRGSGRALAMKNSSCCAISTATATIAAACGSAWSRDSGDGKCKRRRGWASPPLLVRLLMLS